MFTVKLVSNRNAKMLQRPGIKVDARLKLCGENKMGTSHKEIDDDSTRDDAASPHSSGVCVGVEMYPG